MSKSGRFSYYTTNCINNGVHVRSYNAWESGKMRPGGGGALECQGEYQARPKIHIIRVVFQDQPLYARTSFRGAKTCKIGKRVCFWLYRQILERT